MFIAKRIQSKVFYIIYIAAVLFLCLFNFSDTNIKLEESYLGIPADKFIHSLMFMPYPYFCWLALRYSIHIPWIKKYAFLSSILSGILFAAGTEIAQMTLTQNRTADIYDFVADLCGLAIGLLPIALHKLIFKKR